MVNPAPVKLVKFHRLYLEMFLERKDSSHENDRDRRNVNRSLIHLWMCTLNIYANIVP